MRRPVCKKKVTNQSCGHPSQKNGRLAKPKTGPVFPTVGKMPRQIDDLMPHPVADIFPLNANGPEFEEFVEDIKDRKGLLHPIVLHDGKILDGRRRYRACQQAKVSPRFVVWDGKGLPVDYVFSANVHRRHLNPSQLAVVATNALPFYQKDAKDRQRLSKGRGKKGRKPALP